VQILRDKGVEPQIVEYLKTTPDATTLKKLASMMGLRPKDFIRRREVDFKELGLKDKLEDDAELFRQMVAHPKLMERPIAIKGDQVVLGRPPDRVLELLH
jgi:arsenate reductase|tara:strand:- start:2190 stop:2489 length:300 start_codon:yes stop_codon:yes gene_type:complete